MADNDRGDSRELHESPFATLARQVAGLRVENGDAAPQSEAENDTRLVEIIDSLCMSCEETVRVTIGLENRFSNKRGREKRECF